MRTRLFHLAKASLVSSMLLFGIGAAVRADAQINPNPTGPGASPGTEITTNSATLPRVYTIENTGASTPAPTFPAFSNLPIIRPLPDPFVYLSTGARDTSFGAWEQHRNEILAGFENYMIGPKPTCSDCTITSSYVPTSATKGTLTTTVTRTNPTNGLTTVKLTSAVVLPSGTTPANGWPFVIGIDSATGSMPASIFPSNQIATIVYTESQVTTSDSPTPTDPFYKMYNPLCSFECASLPTVPGSPYNGNSGQYAAWSWGVSRLLDGIQLASHVVGTGNLPLDTTHSAISGCSYAGKLALWAGALDERIALTIAEESGGGGVPNWRYTYNADSEYSLGTHDGSTEDVDTTDHHWFASTLHNQFSSVDVYKLPVDLHELAAMVAPRALVETGNTIQHWLANGSNYVSARAVQKVYNTLGVGDRFGFIVDSDHGHCAPPAAESAAVGQFVNKFLLGQNVSTDVESYPNGPTGIPTPAAVPSDKSNNNSSYTVYFPSMDYQRWTNWWGTGNPQFTNDWNTGGSTDLWFNNPLTINTGDTVKAGYAIRMSAANHPAATVKLGNENLQTDVTCSDGSSYTLYIPLETTYGNGQTFTIAANDTNWYPSASSTDPSTYQGSTTVTTQIILGSTINPGCKNGGPGQASRTYFVALGVQDGANGNPAGPGFVTTDTTLSPIVVQFHLADTTNGGGGAWSAPVTINQLPVSIRE